MRKSQVPRLSQRCKTVSPRRTRRARRGQRTKRLIPLSSLVTLKFIRSFAPANRKEMLPVLVPMQRVPLRSLRLCERHKDLTAEGAEIAEKGHDSWISNIFFSLPVSIFLCVLRALSGESFCFARRRDCWNSLRFPLETARNRNYE